jgi:acyl-CoA thioesterase I
MRNRRLVGAWLLAVLLALLAACEKQSAVLPRLGPQDIILAFGDSLTYGTGAAPDDSYPQVLARLIGRSVIAAGVPGESTTGGLVRLEEVLDQHQPRLLLLCLGGNDMLQQVDPAVTEANLRRMVEIARARNISVVLIAVPKPVLFGGNGEFYQRIAADFALPIESSVLNDVLKNRTLKSDPIHPNAQGYRHIAEAVAELLRGSGAI